MCIFAKSLFVWSRGVSSLLKHMAIEAKIVIYSARSLECHYLHKMDRYGNMCDDPFD